VFFLYGWIYGFKNGDIGQISGWKRRRNAHENKLSRSGHYYRCAAIGRYFQYIHIEIRAGRKQVVLELLQPQDSFTALKYGLRLSHSNEALIHRILITRFKLRFPLVALLPFLMFDDLFSHDR
jgi:hypothetical protein